MTAPPTDLRLVAPAVAAWAAAVVLLPYPRLFVPVALALWTLGGILLATAARGSPGVGRKLSGRLHAVLHTALHTVAAPVAVAAAAIALVATSAAVHADARRPPQLVAVAGQSTAVEATLVATQTVPADASAADDVSASGRAVSGRAVSGRAAPGESTQFAATVVAVTVPGTRAAPERTVHFAAAVPVLVFDAAPGERIGIGAQLVVSGTMAPTDPEDDVSYLFFASGEARVSRGPPWYLAWADGLRSGFAAESARLSGDGARLLPGLAIGDTTAVDERLNTAMKASSLSHLTAVSGANCAIVISLILLAGRLLRLGRLWRIAASLLVLIGFVVLVTPEPSVLRAALMATLVLVALASGRPLRGLPVLGCAVLALLVFDPWLARSYGFALSVLATGGLLVLARPLTALLARVLPEWIAAVIAIPLAAQLACQPVLLLLNPTVSLYGVVANILAAPAAPIATVLGLIGCLALPVFPAAGALVMHIAWLPATWIARVATVFAALPGGTLPWAGGLAGAVLLAAVTALALVVSLVPLRPRIRRRGTALLVVIVVCAVAASIGTTIGAQFGKPDNWQVAACDIGQGDAMVVRSAGEIALIDTGPDPAPLSACLDALQIDRIDLLVLSHFDLDHVGGTATVVGRVDRALVGPPDGPAARALLDDLAEGGARVDRVSRGVGGTLGELRWSVLWPADPLGDIEPGNDASVTVEFRPAGRCASGCLSSLFVGDLGERAQERMLSLNRRLGRVQVLEVAHHGSADQSERLYTVAAPAVALIGVGVDNGYGHPTARLLTILAAVGAAVGRTDTDGLVLVAPGAGGVLTVWRSSSGVAGGG